jgi:tetratricopeptide (TPR) repeat protein
MFAALVALALSAAPEVSKAEALAAKGDAEALFLQFGDVRPADYPQPQRTALAQALLKGAESARNDPMVAVALAEKGAQLDRTPQALVLLASVEVDLDQRGAAASHLDEAVSLNADFAPALVARAELAMKENDFVVAIEMYERAQKAGAKGVKVPLAKAREARAAKEKAVDHLKKTELEIKTRVADAAKNATRDWLRQIVSDDADNDEKRRLAPDGVRRKEMANFVFTYSTGSKKTQDMFAFEGKVEKLLEKTYDFVTEKLGVKRSGRTLVVLMTREEFSAKHAGTPLARAGGYWDGRQIVINGGSAIDEGFAQVMVHEFTHAVVSDLVGHAIPKWMNEGLAENMRLSAIGLDGKLEERSRAMLSAMKEQQRIPSLNDLDPQFAAMAAGVEAAYALSALAVKLLVDRRGHAEYVEALRELKSRSPAQVVEQHYMPITQLDKTIHDTL